MTDDLEATVSESYPVNRTEGSKTIGDTHAQVPGGERRQIRRAFAGIWPSWHSDRQHMKQWALGIRKFRQSVWVS
jgi:hypothetical protein